MLGIKYFGHLEHYCFEKKVISDFFFRSICDVIDDVIQPQVQIVKSGNDVI